MRVSFILVALASALAASAATIETRGLGDFPKCAVSCLLKAPRGKCKVTDFHCLCHNQGFINASTSCIEHSCPPADVTKARAAQAKTCKGQ